MAERSSNDSGVVCASRRSTRRKLLEKEVESASKQSRTECETNNGEYSSAGVVQVMKQNPPQKKAGSKGMKKSTSTNAEGLSVRATTTQAALATKKKPAQRKGRTSKSKETRRPEPISGKASSAGATTARTAQATQQKTTKKKARTIKTKAMKKSERDELLQSITSIDGKIIQWEVISKLKETFDDSGLLKDFASVLCSLEHPLQDVVAHHHCYFGALYINSKKLADSFLRFQLDWHNYCSIFLLSEEYSLQDIDYQELAEHPVSTLRSTWLEFCKANGVPVPQSNKVMITVSSAVYHFLLEHVTRFQQQLVKSGSVTIGTDEDGVYYRFAGAALCSMLHALYKEIKQCSDDQRNVLSQKITVLQAINTKDKSCIPGYLKYRDRGYMYFPDPLFIPYIREVDTILKQVVNSKGLNEHGAELIKVNS